MLRSAFAAYEAFLRIDPRDKAEDLVRARAMVWFGWSFVLIQLFNMVGMTLTYGRWTGDHTVSVLVIILLLSAVHAIRYYKNYAVYGFFVMVLTVAGVLASALPTHTGINSALIPILIMTPMLNGFISGPRVALVSGAAMLAAIVVLYFCSATHDITGVVINSTRDLQRALQSGYIVVMATIVSTIFSANIFRAFGLLEANVARISEAEAVKSQFLAAMSHELRTPLNGVLGLSEVLQKTPLNVEQAQMIKEIGASGRSLLAILNDILDMVKIDAKKIEINSAPFDLRDLIKGVASAWRLPAEEKGLVLEAGVDVEAPQCLVGDELRIRQVAAKIVSNAVKYTHSGSIKIAATVRTDEQDGSWLEIAVTDTGPGISEEAGKRIFNTFEQAESGSARSQDGAGLGLAICQKLAALMDGEVHFDTEEGEGTTFRFVLPVKAVEPVISAATDENKTGVLRGMRVLVVEDNMINRMVAVRLLSSMGVECETAEDGAKCLECVHKQNFDAILMDIHMPVMDGVKATAEIRAMDGPVRTIPIIACTADALCGAREALLDASFDEYIPKPINSDGLYTVLVRAMKRISVSGKAAA